MKTIVIGYDDTEPAKRALERAAQLAKVFGSTLVVTSVAPMLAASARGGGPIDPTDPPAHHAEELKLAQAYLAAQGLEAKLQPAVGDPADTIVEVAEREGADLIVVGTREPGLLERVLGNSVSAGVSRHAHCDVLIVH